MTEKQYDRVIVFDTTLRDGEQSPGFSMSVEEKVGFARALAALRVDVIEAGFPISSPAQYEAVGRIAEQAARDKELGKHTPIIAALARAHPQDIDAALKSLDTAIKSGIGRVHTFVSTSPLHMEYKLKKTPDEVAKLTKEMVALARRHTPDVEFSLEDATRTEKGFMYEIIGIALQQGATTINIPDTVGYAVPDQYAEMVRGIIQTFPQFKDGKAVLSVHCHNDLGHAVANTLAGLNAGARQVECTVNGIGERAGNAALEEVVMALRTRSDFYRLGTGIKTRQIYPASRFLSKITKIGVQPNKAIVGANAFAHEAGIHQHGVLAMRETYEIMKAEDVGRSGAELILGRHSGKAAVISRLNILLSKVGRKVDESLVDRLMTEFNGFADGKKKVTDDELLWIYERASKPNGEVRF